EQVDELLNALRDRATISKLSAAYLENEKVSLINDIQNNLSSQQIASVLAAVSQLPKYTPA
ncbi:MAG: hypothetical protein AAFO69_12405, partial [Bacteroidota bacterium]